MNRSKRSAEAVRFAIDITVTGFMERIKTEELTAEMLENTLLYIARQSEHFARRDELERIQEDTLDADMDVWSHNNDGTIMLLADRLKGLRDDVMGAK